MSIYDDIRAERARQNAKWGGPAHVQKGSAMQLAMIGNMRDRLVKAAAILVAQAESLDREIERINGKEDQG